MNHIPMDWLTVVFIIFQGKLLPLKMCYNVQVAHQAIPGSETKV